MSEVKNDSVMMRELGEALRAQSKRWKQTTGELAAGTTRLRAYWRDPQFDEFQRALHNLGQTMESFEQIAGDWSMRLDRKADRLDEAARVSFER